MADYAITVTMQEQTVYIDNITQGFRITADVTEPGENDDVSPLPDHKIFLYHRQIPDVASGAAAVDTFIAVCSPMDMQEYPADEPGSDAPHYFRLAGIDLIHTSRDVLLQTWDLIKADIEKLGETLVAMKTLAEGDTVTIDWS